MREIYLVDRVSRLNNIITSDSLLNESDTSPLGIGFYNCQKLGADASAPGVTFRTSPVSLRSELLKEVLAGRHSPLSQDIILLGVGNDLPFQEVYGQNNSKQVSMVGNGIHNAQNRCVKRWLLLGLQPIEELATQKIPLSKMNLMFLEAQTLATGVSLILTEVFSKVTQLKASSVVFSVDSSIIVDFFFSVFGRVPFGLGLSEVRTGRQEELSPIEREICSHRVSEEIVSWIALNGADVQVIFKCENARHLQGLTSICRVVRSSGLNRQITFRL